MRDGSDQSHPDSSSARAALIVRAASTTSRAARDRDAASERKAGASSPIAPTIPSSRKTGAAIATDPSMSSPSLVARPVMTTVAEALAELVLGRRRLGDAHQILREHLFEDLRRREGEQHPAERPGIQRRHLARLERDPERGVALDLVEADARQADPADDDRGLARVVDEHPESCVGVPDEALAADVRARPDEQLRTEPEHPATAIDEAEVAERPQVAIDRRQGHLERGAQLVGPDLAAIGDGQQEAQPRANEVSSAASSGGRSRAVVIGDAPPTFSAGGNRHRAPMVAPTGPVGPSAGTGSGR